MVHSRAVRSNELDALGPSKPDSDPNVTRVGVFWQKRRFDLAAFTLIACFFVAFFWRALFTGKFFVTSDAFIYSYPLRTMVWEELRHGRLPLWTSQIMSGYPLLSMAQIGVGYPLTWFYLLLPGRFAETIYDLAPYLLFPIFIYCYLREVGRSRVAAILAGLSFGYGGFLISPVAYNGLLGNALMWLPLTLIALERARTRRFSSCLLGATLTYSLSVLSGIGQGFFLAGLIAVAYAVFLGLADGRLRAVDYAAPRLPVRWWLRWQPLLVMFGAILFSSGVAAFQILETLRAQRRSIRKQLTFDLFSFGSYRPLDAVKATLLPLYYHLEACGYVAPLVLLLAGVAIIVTLRSRDRDWRVFFWLGLAVWGFVLTMGQYTPIFSLLFHVPVLNLFRGAARHAFEQTLAVSILGAYGWDAALKIVERMKLKRAGDASPRPLVLAVLAMFLTVLAGLLWFKDVARIPVRDLEVYYYPPDTGVLRYALWKLVFSLLTLVVVWLVWKVTSNRLGVCLSVALILLACFFEPSIMAARWWWPTLKPASRFSVASPTTKYLQQFPADQNRVYSFVYPFIEEYVAQPRLEPSNLTMLHGLHNVAGYEPLILERYSRALGDTYVEAVRPRPGFAGDPNIFASSSHVLDLLNTRFVVSYPYLSTEPATKLEKEGIKFNTRDLDTLLKPGQTTQLKGAAADADTLALVTATAFSAGEPDGAEVAKIRLYSASGKVIERSLRLGIDTAEWAHDRPDVRAIVRHSLARVFSGEPGEQSKYTFFTALPLGERLTIDRLEIINASKNDVLILNKATLFDSVARFSMPLPHYDLQKWRPVYEDDQAQILRNEKAMPRAWLVSEAESVNGEEALERIRGQAGSFDPRRTALLEVRPENLPALPGGQISAAANARIDVYENNRMSIQTWADTAAVLVVSEINYPGWIAMVDGNAAAIHTADFLLRGVVLPAGSHRVEMRYTAPGARNGAVISALTILLLTGLAVYSRRKRNEPRMIPETRA